MLKKSQTVRDLSILLFGTPAILLDQQPLAELRRKNRALVYYIAAHARPLTRDALLNFFWPDHARPAAQQILRTMLHDLRQHLGRALLIQDETLALDDATRVDARQFERSLADRSADSAALTAALELYRGDFLQGFSLPDAPQFDDWVASEQEHFRLLAVRGLADLAQRYASQRDYAAALEQLNRALAFDSLQEDLQREALRLHYLSGDRAGAIRRYESLVKLLDDEMGVPPMSETRAVYDAVVTDTLPLADSTPTALSVHPSPPPAALAGLPFTGRAEELGQLSSLVTAGKLVLIEGEPGIGKTRLAHEFIAGRTNALVLTGSAHALEQGLPYQPIVEALRGLAALPAWPTYRLRLGLQTTWALELEHLVPELKLETPPRSGMNVTADEARVWEALRQLLLNLAHHRPVILFLDDLHWADASTIAWLSYMTRRIASSEILLIGTTRPVSPRTALAACVQTLTHENLLARLVLAPLTPVDLRTLAERLDVKHAAPLSEWLAQRAEGNPFFVAELIRYARTAGPEDGDLLGTSAIPPSIHNLIESRLARLSEGARRVLDVAAVIGPEFDDDLVMRTAGLDEDRTLDALDELRAAVLVQARGSRRLAFDHWLTMQAVLETMSDTRRRALHRRVAQALEEIHFDQLDSISGLIARHWAQADAPAHVAPHAFRAGRYAASVAAWTEAIAFYDQALATETDPAQRIAIWLALASARFNHGDLPLASEAARSAIALAEEREDWVRLEQAHLALNLTQFVQGHYTEAISVAQELRRTCPPDLALAAEFMWGMALSLESTHPVEAEFHLREASKLLMAPRGFTSQLTPATLKYQLANAIGQQGKLDEAIALYREVLTLIAADQDALDLQRHILLYNGLAYYLYLQGDPEAEDYVNAGLKLAREKGSSTHLSYLLSTAGEIALAHGGWDKAQSCFEEGLEIAQRLNIPDRLVGLSANLGRVALARGNAAQARILLTEALERANQMSATHLAVRIRIWLAPLLSTAEARACLSEARVLAKSSGYAHLLDDIAALEAS